MKKGILVLLAAAVCLALFVGLSGWIVVTKDVLLSEKETYVTADGGFSLDADYKYSPEGKLIEVQPAHAHPFAHDWEPNRYAARREYIYSPDGLLERVNDYSIDYLSAGNAEEIAVTYEYTYDGAGVPTKISVWEKGMFSNADNTDWQLQSVEHTYSLTYNGAGQLTGVTYRDTEYDFDWNVLFTYDSAGNILRETWQNNADLEAYEWPEFEEWYSRTYSYDAAGRLVKLVGVVNITPMADRFRGFECTYSYDDEGSLREISYKTEDSHYVYTHKYGTYVGWDIPFLKR